MKTTAHLAAREERERRAAIKRTVDNLLAWNATHPIAATMGDSPGRDTVLEALDEYDREQFLKLEEWAWPQDRNVSPETREALVEAVELTASLLKILDRLSRGLPGYRGLSALQAREKMQMVLGSVSSSAALSGIDVGTKEEA